MSISEAKQLCSYRISIVVYLGFPLLRSPFVDASHYESAIMAPNKQRTCLLGRFPDNVECEILGAVWMLLKSVLAL